LPFSFRALSAPSSPPRLPEPSLPPPPSPAGATERAPLPGGAPERFSAGALLPPSPLPDRFAPPCACTGGELAFCRPALDPPATPLEAATAAIEAAVEKGGGAALPPP
ncbi:unnamed protein product, partial [Ectocarpus fasciculatus]